MPQRKYLMKLKNLVILILIATSLSGCATLRTFFTSDVTVEDSGAMVCRIPYDITPPPPINMRDVRFYTLTLEIMKEIVEGNPKDMPTVFIALTTDGYENMSYNMAEIVNYIKANKVLLNEIRMYYDGGSVEKRD